MSVGLSVFICNFMTNKPNAHKPAIELTVVRKVNSSLKSYVKYKMSSIFIIIIHCLLLVYQYISFSSTNATFLF